MEIKSELISNLQDLSDEKLLRKCTHSKTQNNNKSSNAVIWKKCLKFVYCFKKILKLGLYSSVLDSNEECSGIKPIFNTFGCQSAKFLGNSLRKHDLKPLDLMRKKSTLSGMIQ